MSMWQNRLQMRIRTSDFIYTLSWKGCGETIRILFDTEDNAKIWDEFFMFGKAE